MHDIDKNAVENIQKKLKLLNKVQSSYKEYDDYRSFEIETVKEVLLKPRRHYLKTLSLIRSAINPRKDTKKLIQKFSNRKLRNMLRIHEKINDDDAHIKVPLLILQTDHESLLYKQSKWKNNETPYLYRKKEAKSLNYSQITEQITTV